MIGDSWRASHVEWTGMTESHHVRRRDSGGLAKSTVTLYVTEILIKVISK
jgi:hypothetical protein